MIYYPLEAMVKAGIKEILLTSSPDHAGDFANLLESGEDFGVRLYYAIQKNPTGGIAEGISLAKEFVQDEKVLVILGDNIFSFNLKRIVDEFKNKKRGAVIFGTETDTSSRQYGVVEIGNNGKVLSIEEKPEFPKSKIAQTGIYMYDERVFEFIKKLKPSSRGQLEVTDLNNLYLKEGTLQCQTIKWWIDAGTSHEELLRAGITVSEKVKRGEL
jgi:glucose-1-phosphate thymidylyltransferase